MDINQVGILIGYKRTKENITVAELSEGICSRSYLELLELGKRKCEKIVSEAFLQRLGLDADQFLYFLEKEEEQWLQIKEKLIQAINEVDVSEAEYLLKEYEMVTRKKSKLHRQFISFSKSILYWRMISQGIEDKQATYSKLEQKLLEAWRVTRGNYSLDGECPKCMGYLELSIKFFFWCAQEEQGRKIEALQGYRQLLEYLEKRVEPGGRARIYPEIAYRTLRLLLSIEGTELLQEQIYQNCMQLLISQGEMVCLKELSEYRYDFLRRLDKNEQNTKKMMELEDLTSTLNWLYKEYQIKTENVFCNLSFGREEVFALADIIRKRRLAFGWTQEELAEGICDPVSISRIENGVSNCRRGNLGALMDKIHLPGGTAICSVQLGRTDLYDIVEEIKRLSKFSRYEQMEPLFETLKQKTVHDRYADQYVMSREATLQRNTKSLDNNLYWKQQKQALYMTLPEKEPEDLEMWVFTRTEAMIINALAYGCKKIGKVQEAIQWLELVKRFYEQQPFHMNHYVRGYELTLRNLGDLYGEIEAYENAIQCEDVAIKLSLETESAHVLRMLVFDRGWNMEQLSVKGVYTKEESRPYVKAALVLNKLYAKPESVAFVERYWKQNYEDTNL